MNYAIYMYYILYIYYHFKLTYSVPSVSDPSSFYGFLYCNMCLLWKSHHSPSAHDVWISPTHHPHATSAPPSTRQDAWGLSSISGSRYEYNLTSHPEPQAPSWAAPQFLTAEAMWDKKCLLWVENAPFWFLSEWWVFIPKQMARRSHTPALSCYEYV